jgi:shikimate kinase
MHARLFRWAGGVPTREANRRLLQNAARNGAAVVYLQTSPTTLAARVRRAPGKRPLIDGEGELSLEDTQKRVEALLAEREEFYRNCANLEIATDDLTVQGVARTLIDKIQETRES